jgi:GNAT superfamily N-acetyltransferase
VKVNFCIENFEVQCLRINEINNVKMTYKCRLAVHQDLEQIVEMFHEYDKDEPLGKTLDVDYSYSSSLAQGLAAVIDMGGVIIAYNEDKESDLVGFLLFYTRHVRENKEEKMEEASLAYAKELGMESVAPMYGICHVCFEWDKLETDFTYLEILSVRREFRGKRIATLLVEEFEKLESTRNIPVWISVATAIGTSKILTKLGWEAYSTTQTEDYEFFGKKPFQSLKHEITAFRKFNPNK